jgi:hypothetical protein
MATLWIHDLEDRSLAFDLIDLLNLLAPKSRTARWVVSTVKSIDPNEEWFEAQGEAGEILGNFSDVNAEISGVELIELARKSHQVIWGEFSGLADPRSQDIWIVIRAMDSSFYEVVTDDIEAIQKIQFHFRDVRFGEAPIGQTRSY